MISWNVNKFAKGVHKRFTIPVGLGISGTCAKTGEVMNVKDASRDPRTSQKHATSTGYKMNSTLCAPVLDQRPGARTSERPALGVIQLLNKVDSPGHFTTSDETALAAFCSIVGLAMRNAMAFDEMRERGLLRLVDAAGDEAQVFERLRDALGSDAPTPTQTPTPTPTPKSASHGEAPAEQATEAAPELVP